MSVAQRDTKAVPPPSPAAGTQVSLTGKAAFGWMFWQALAAVRCPPINYLVIEHNTLLGKHELNLLSELV